MAEVTLIKRVLLVISMLALSVLTISSVRVGGNLVVAPFSKAYSGYWDTVSFNDDSHKAYYVDVNLYSSTKSGALTATFDIAITGSDYIFRYSQGMAERTSYGRSDFRLGRRYGASEYGLIFSGLSFSYTGLVSHRLSPSNNPVYFDGRLFTPSQTALYLREDLRLFMTGLYVGVQLGEIYLSASAFLPFLTFGSFSSRLILSDGIKSIGFPLHPGTPARLSAEISSISVNFGFSLRVF